MVFIKKQPGDSQESMIRKFSRAVVAAGLIPDMKRREFHLKPSAARKYKQQLARKKSIARPQ